MWHDSFKDKTEITRFDPLKIARISYNCLDFRPFSCLNDWVKLIYRLHFVLLCRIIGYIIGSSIDKSDMDIAEFTLTY